MKLYKLPKNYIDFKIFQSHSQAISSIPPRKFSLYNQINVESNLSYLFESWSKGYPVYCVRESLLQDMLQTDVGENIPLFVNIEANIPCFTLFFPRGTVLSPCKDKGYIQYLVVYLEQLNSPEFKYLFSWGGLDSNENIIFSCKFIRTDGTFKVSAFSNDDITQQQNALNIRNLILQSILLLQYYPKLQQEVSADELEITPNKGFAPPQKTCNLFQTPRWLGNASEPRNQISGTNGNGSSKSIHYRRGFWRLQPTGAGRSDIRCVFVRPAWVNQNNKPVDANTNVP